MSNDETYKGLLALRDKLDARQSELKAELEDVTEKLRSVSTTLTLLDEAEMPLTHRIAVQEHSTVAPIDVAGLRGLTQAQALERIAAHNGGQFETAQAKKLLIQAGLISNPKNASNIIFNVIQRTEKFERVAPGLYRLKGDKPLRPQRPLLPEDSV